MRRSEAERRREVGGRRTESGEDGGTREGGDSEVQQSQTNTAVDGGPGGPGASPGHALGRAWLGKVRGAFAGWFAGKGDSISQSDLTNSSTFT